MHAATAPVGRRNTAPAALLVLLLLATWLLPASAASADDAPSLTVSPTSGLDPDGQTITVTGSGFDPAGNVGTRPPLSGQPAGVYVQFSHVSDGWKPSEGGGGADRPDLGDGFWVIPESSCDAITAGPFGSCEFGDGSWEQLEDDGTFELELEVARVHAREADHPDGRYAVITFPGSGATNPAEELEVELTFARTSGSATTSVSSVEPGGEVTIEGDGFVADEELVVELRSDPVELGTAEADADGAASATVTIPEDTEPGTHQLALVGADHEVVASLEVLSVTATDDGPRTATDGYLDWGVKTSFREYVTGNIANGEIETGDGASQDGEVFRFTSPDGEVDVDARELDAALEGWVRFFGHVMGGQPALDLTVADPRVVIDGDTGTLYLDVDSLPLGEDTPIVADGVAFADLDLSGVDWDLEDDVLTLTDVAVTLTADGADAFAGFYEAGEELDPLTLVLGLEDAEVAVPDNGGGTTPDTDEDPSSTPEDGFDDVASGAADGYDDEAPTLPETGLTGVLALLAITLLGAGSLLLRFTRQGVV